MNSLQLHVDETKIKLSGTSIAGEVWISLNDREFPHASWSDFVVVVLEAWSAAVMRVIDGASTCESVYFMEGPYLVKLSRGPKDLFNVRAFERSRGEREVASADTTATALIRMTNACVEKVIDVCRRGGIHTDDVRRLEEANEPLRRRLLAQAT